MGLCGLRSRGWFAGPSQGSGEDGAQLWRPLRGPSPSAEHVPISMTLCWDRRCLPPSPHLNHMDEVIAKRAGTWQVLGTGMQVSWEPESASHTGTGAVACRWTSRRPTSPLVLPAHTSLRLSKPQPLSANLGEPVPRLRGPVRPRRPSAGL